MLSKEASSTIFESLVWLNLVLNPGLSGHWWSGLCCPWWRQRKWKESENKDKYLNLARELKKLWNMKVTFIPIVISALGTVTEGLIKGLEDLEIRGRAETIQTTTLLRTARILKRDLEAWGDLLSLKLQWKTISIGKCEKLSRNNNNNNNKKKKKKKK